VLPVLYRKQAVIVVDQQLEQESITIEDVQRVLEVGRILLSVLTQEEIELLQELLSENNTIQEKVTLASLDADPT
jgi:hypothetical protein